MVNLEVGRADVALGKANLGILRRLVVMLGVQLVSKGLVSSLGEKTLLIKKGEDTHGLKDRNEIHTQIRFSGRNSLKNCQSSQLKDQKITALCFLQLGSVYDQQQCTDNRQKKSKRAVLSTY